MSSLIIRPNSDHTIAQSTQGSLDHYQNIDEETLNEADYNYYTNANGSKTDIYGFVNPTSDAGVRAQAINSVTLKIQAKKVIYGTDTTAIQIGLLVRVSDINYTQNVTPTTSTSELSYSWALNPNTGSAWTWTQLDNILAGDTINAHRIDKNNYCGSQVYQMWIVVTYGASAANARMVKINGVWKTISSTKIMIDGVWKNVTSNKIFINDTWKS